MTTSSGTIALIQAQLSGAAGDIDAILARLASVEGVLLIKVVEPPPPARPEIEAMG